MIDNTSRAEKIVARVNELATFTETPGIITRTFGSDALINAGKKVMDWMQGAGLETSIDSIGNVRGFYQSNKADAQTLIIGSHIDSVVNAGKYDGPLGVVMAIELVETFKAQDAEFPFNILVVAFSDEEGVRFHTTYLGSKVLAGCFDENLLSKTDAQGVSIEELINKQFGNVNQFKHDAIQNALAYFEMHIEQGPVLYNSNIPVAAVTAIAGQKRIELTFTGVAGHAGTVPMDMRKDALCCAAECILGVEEYALTNISDFVATVGKLEVVSSASNVIPGLVKCTLDIRSSEEVRLNFACNAIQHIIKEICVDRGIYVDWKTVQETSPVACDEKLVQCMKDAINKSGYEAMGLVSGAGHDGVAMSNICPVSMMFIRCFEGISHNPLENVEISDIAVALTVAENYINNLASLYK